MSSYKQNLALIRFCPMLTFGDTFGVQGKGIKSTICMQQFWCGLRQEQGQAKHIKDFQEGSPPKKL